MKLRLAAAMIGGLLASPAGAVTFADLTVSAPSPFVAGIGVTPTSVTLSTSVSAVAGVNPTASTLETVDWIVTRTNLIYDPAMSFDFAWDLGQDPGGTAFLRYQVSVGQASVGGLLDCTFGCGPRVDFLTVDDAGAVLPLGQPVTIPITVSLSAWAIDPVPEPGTAALLCGMLLGVALMIGVTAVQERIRWGFWPWQYTPEKMRRTR